MSTYQELEEKAAYHESAAREIRERAMNLRRKELEAKPLAERLIYAAYTRCPCGAGLAYDPASTDRCWDCSAIMLKIADFSRVHTDKMPFAFYEIASELKDANDWRRTTRPNHEG